MEQRQTLRGRLEWLIFDSDYDASLVANGLFLFAWITAFFFVPNLFSVSRSYAVMATLAPQTTWGCGSALLLLVLVLSAIFRWRRVHSITLFATFLWWLFVFGMYVLAVTYTPGTGMLLVTAITAAWAYWRARGKQRGRE